MASLSDTEPRRWQHHGQPISGDSRDVLADDAVCLRDRVDGRCPRTTTTTRSTTPDSRLSARRVKDRGQGLDQGRLAGAVLAGRSVTPAGISSPFSLRARRATAGSVHGYRPVLASAGSRTRRTNQANVVVVVRSVTADLRRAQVQQAQRLYDDGRAHRRRDRGDARRARPTVYGHLDRTTVRKRPRAVPPRSPAAGSGQAPSTPPDRGERSDGAVGRCSSCGARQGRAREAGNSGRAWRSPGSTLSRSGRARWPSDITARPASHTNTSPCWSARGAGAARYSPARWPSRPSR